MKKIFSKFFMAAAIVVAMGFVSSCKDYNDEMMAEYRGQDASLKAQIEELTQKHNQDLAAAKDERDRIEDELNDHIADAEAKYATKAELEAAKADLKSQYETADATLKAELQGEIDAVNTRIDSLNTEIETLKGLINTNVTDLATVTATVTTMEGQVAKLVGLDEKVATLEEDLKEVATKEELNNYVTQEQLDALKDIVDDLASCGCDLSNFATLADIATLASQADLAALENKVKADSVRIDALETTIEQLKKTIKCDSLASALTALQEEHAKEIAAIQDDMATLYEQIKLNAELAKAYTDDAIDALKDYVVPAINGIEGLLNEVRLDVEDLKDEIEALNEAIENLKEQVQKNTEAIETLIEDIQGVKEDVEDLKDAVKNRISSVLVQGAYSPVVGYFNMPFGIKSNILAAYKGEFLNGQDQVDFPFAMSESMLDGQINPLFALKNSLGGGETITELGEGYAGKLYLTINPAEVDLTDVDFALVNSANDLAPVELATPVETSDVLKFGYTRAGAALYEATATITDADKASIDFNFEDYKEIFSELKNGNVSLSNIANALYSSINEIADANAVRATWTDSLGEHNVYSDFGIAAVAVKPLSFNFMYGNEISSIPGIEKVGNAINKVIDRINVDIEIGNFNDIQITLNKLELDENKFIISIDTTIKVDGQTVTIFKKGDNTGLAVNIGGTFQDIVVNEDVTVDVKGSEVQFTYKNTDIVNEILNVENTVNGQFTEIENVIAQVNSMLAELRKTEDSINQTITNAKDEIKNQLDKYLDKLNNKLCNVINSFNDKLQPAMFVKTSDSFGMLSQVKSMPTVIENGTVLVPTTYTAELLAPVCKKWVAITAVNGSTDNLAAANSGDLNKVLEGDVRTIEFNANPGTYELTYAALDYAGIVSTVKYYVTVK